MLSHVLLHLTRNMLFYFILGPCTVQKEGSAINELLYHIELRHVGRIVAGNEVRSLDKISGLNRLVTKTEVRHRYTAGLLGVIVKVSLRILIRIITNNLDGVLVCADRSVCTETPELTVYRTGRCRHNCRTFLKRKMRNIIVDTDRESLLIFVVVNSHNLCRSCILGTQAVTTGKNGNILEGTVGKSSNNIKIKRLTD